MHWDIIFANIVINMICVHELLIYYCNDNTFLRKMCQNYSDWLIPLEIITTFSINAINQWTVDTWETYKIQAGMKWSVGNIFNIFTSAIYIYILDPLDSPRFLQSLENSLGKSKRWGKFPNEISDECGWKSSPRNMKKELLKSSSDRFGIIKLALAE